MSYIITLLCLFICYFDTENIYSSLELPNRIKEAKGRLAVYSLFKLQVIFEKWIYTVNDCMKIYFSLRVNLWFLLSKLHVFFSCGEKVLIGERHSAMYFDFSQSFWKFHEQC